MSLIKLDVRTTTDQVLYIDSASGRLYATPLGVDLATVSIDAKSLLPVDASSILAAGVAVTTPTSTHKLVKPRSKPKSSKSKPKSRIRDSPFEASSSRPLRVAIYQ